MNVVSLYFYWISVWDESNNNQLLRIKCCIRKILLATAAPAPAGKKKNLSKKWLISQLCISPSSSLAYVFWRHVTRISGISNDVPSMSCLCFIFILLIILTLEAELASISPTRGQRQGWALLHWLYEIHFWWNGYENWPSTTFKKFSTSFYQAGSLYIVI